MERYDLIEVRVVVAFVQDAVANIGHDPPEEYLDGFACPPPHSGNAPDELRLSDLAHASFPPSTGPLDDLRVLTIYPPHTTRVQVAPTRLPEPTGRPPYGNDRAVRATPSRERMEANSCHQNKLLLTGYAITESFIRESVGNPSAPVSLEVSLRSHLTFCSTAERGDMHRTMMAVAVAACLGAAAPIAAQDRGTPLEVGTVAPDFEIPGATRYGVLREPIRLSDFRGKTVVLAFFFRARTRG